MSLAQSDQSAADWAVPGAWPVAEGLYRLPIRMPTSGLRAINVYAIIDRDVTLIDSGWGSLEAREDLDRALRSVGKSLADVREVLVTHSHNDHYGLAVHLRRDFGTRIRIGVGERENIENVIADWDSAFNSLHARLEDAGAEEFVANHRSWLAQNPQYRRLPGEYYELPDEWIEPGELMTVGDIVLEAVATPGHTTGHMVFMAPKNGFVFGGDHLLPTITPSVSFESSRPQLPLGDFLASHELMLRMPQLQVLPAHGHTGSSSHERSRELVDYHEARLAALRSAIDDGAHSAVQAARCIRWTKRDSQLDELDPFNQVLAVSETVVHLELLAHRGLIELHEHPEGNRYQPRRG